MKVRQEKSANKRLEEALAQEREREKERVEKVLKKQEKRRREALLKEQRAAFDKEVDSRVSARVGPMRKSMAELAAEMLMGNLSDRLMLPSSRERRLMKLTKAIEGAALGGGLAALAGALASVGIPNDSVVRYEGDLKAGSFLLLLHGSEAEVDRAKLLLEETSPSRLDSFKSKSTMLVG
jgi:hypothetical protein